MDVDPRPLGVAPKPGRPHGYDIVRSPERAWRSRYSRRHPATRSMTIPPLYFQSSNYSFDEYSADLRFEVHSHPIRRYRLLLSIASHGLYTGPVQCCARYRWKDRDEPRLPGHIWGRDHGWVRRSYVE